MLITATTHEDLVRLADSSQHASLLWELEGSEFHAHNSLAGLSEIFAGHPESFPLSFVAVPNLLTIEGKDLFRSAFIEEADGELYEEETPGGFAWEASAPWACPELFAPIGEWWNPELSAEEMGRAWAHRCLAQMGEGDA